MDGVVLYVTKPYDNMVINGYRYLLVFNDKSYSVVARSETCGVTGTKVIALETGGVI